MNASASDDVMGMLARITPGSTVAAARDMRPDVVRFSQTSDDAILRPKSDGGLTHGERATIALRMANLIGDAAIAAHYETLLAQLDPSGRLKASLLAPAAQDRWSIILAHVDRLTSDPGASRPEHLQALATAGLSPQAILALSQVIAYVSYQGRALAGLRAIGSATNASAPAARLPATIFAKDAAH